MADLLQKCTICSRAFAVQFSYQMEEHRCGDGQSEFRFYCSQECLAKSHTVSGLVRCDACGSGFAVTHASHVCYLTGRRHYACSSGCRQQVLRESNGARLADEVPASRQVQGNHPNVLAVFNHKGGHVRVLSAEARAIGMRLRTAVTAPDTRRALAFLGSTNFLTPSI